MTRAPQITLSEYHPLVRYSRGELSRQDAIRLLKIRDYVKLLMYLGNADLPMPMPPEEQIEEQAQTFSTLYRMG